MHFRKVNARLTPVSVNQVRNLLKQIQTQLPNLVQLSPKERQQLNKMNDKRFSFVEKTVGYAKDNPDLYPSYLPQNSLETDLDNFKDLRAFLWLMEPLCEAVRDSMMQCGHQAITGALRTYHNVKQAAQMNVPGVDTIYADLAREFVYSSFTAEELAEEDPDATPADEGTAV